jgi:hypothetical protein
MRVDWIFLGIDWFAYPGRQIFSVRYRKRPRERQSTVWLLVLNCYSF